MRMMMSCVQKFSLQLFLNADICPLVYTAVGSEALVSPHVYTIYKKINLYTLLLPQMM